MATSSSNGVVGGSVLDVQSLVSQLVAAERAPYDTRVARETQKVTTQISALGALKGALSSFQIALAAFNSVDKFESRTAQSSDAEVFTATAQAGAAPGRYDVEVLALAKAQQLASTPYIGGPTTVIGTGTLTIGVGGLTFPVDIVTGKNTLAGIRDAINAAPANTGVRASLINTADGTRLVLSATKTGELNTIQVTQSGGDGGLAALTYGPANLAHYAELSPAQDASVEIAGYPVESASNTLTGVIDGVTIALQSAAPGDVLELTVAKDDGAVAAKIKAFVAAYNALETQIVKLRGYDAATKTGGPMLGDALLSGLEQQLRRGLTDTVSGAIGGLDTLSALGITTQADGTLNLNESKLATALSDNPDGVTALFVGSGGIATRLTADVTARLASGSALLARSDGLIARQRDLSRQQTDIDARMDVIQARYLRQFSALDNLLSGLQTTSSFLTQQIDSLPKFGNK
jgi:flagellar hook-associated protein 2